MTRTRAFTVGPPALAVAILLLASPLVPSALAGTITVAWDASQDPRVTGYRVYVGTESGRETEWHDVDVTQSAFVFTGAVAGRRYYFAVASRASEEVGPRSPEVSGTIDDELPQRQPEASSSAAGLARGSVPGEVCAERREGSCFAVDVAADALGRITAMAPTPDGRVFVVEEGRRVRVVDQRSGVQPGIALEATPASTFIVGLAVDPKFAETRHVLVGEVAELPDGRRVLSVSRYREVQGILGEGATLVTGLRLPPGGDASIAWAAAGFIYVVTPDEQRSSGLEATSALLRFSRDGTVPRDNPAGSPVLARGLPESAALLIEPATDILWIVGSGERGRPSLGRVEAGRASFAPLEFGPAADVQIDAAALVVDARTADARFFFVDRSGSLWTRGGTSDGAPRLIEGLDTVDVVAVAAGQDGGLHVAVHDRDALASAPHRILRLRRRW